MSDTSRNLPENDRHAYCRRDGMRRNLSARLEILLIRGKTRNQHPHACRATGTGSGRGRRRRCLARRSRYGNPGMSRPVFRCEDRRLYGSHHMKPVAWLQKQVRCGRPGTRALCVRHGGRDLCRYRD